MSALLKRFVVTKSAQVLAKVANYPDLLLGSAPQLKMATVRDLAMHVNLQLRYPSVNLRPNAMEIDPAS
jgi:hypothetical protein